jgi:hypothetical protein
MAQRARMVPLIARSDSRQCIDGFLLFRLEPCAIAGSDLMPVAPDNVFSQADLEAAILTPMQ